MKNAIILFDLDGTLIDSTEAIYESFAKTMKENNKNIPSIDSVKRMIGYTLEDIFLSFDISNTDIPHFVETYKIYYKEVCNQKTKLLRNANKAILTANEFAYLGIVTTKTGKYSKMLLEHYNLLQYFKSVIGRENVENPKPHQEPVIKAIQEIDKEIDKNNIFLIGDTPLDIKAANNAQIKHVAVTSGYADIQLLQNYTNSIAKDSLEAVIRIRDTVQRNS